MVHVYFFVKIFWYFEIYFFLVEGSYAPGSRMEFLVILLSLKVRLLLKLLPVLFWTIIRILYWENNHLNNIWNFENAMHVLLPIVVLVSEKDMWLKAVFSLEIINFLSLWEKQPHQIRNNLSSNQTPFIHVTHPRGSMQARAGWLELRQARTRGQPLFSSSWRHSCSSIKIHVHWYDWFEY
jgi:hypothetical protein